MFEKARFIKGNLPYRKDENAAAPLLRKAFTLEELPKQAVISFVALGYGVVYINGVLVTEDKFLSPVSDYMKTLWYTEYDVTNLLQKGENVIAALLGNGWYNEFVENTWKFHEAPWRDNPKLILQLVLDGKEAVVSDESWVFTDKSPVVFNQLRVGEYFDARLYDNNWNKVGYDDSAWKSVKLDDTPPTGIFRKCECEPLRECAYYQPQRITKLGEDHYLFDFGQNMSGYARLKVNQQAGDLITLTYGERCEEVMVKITSTHHYKGYADLVQVDKLICSGEEMVWAPSFTYHGFRYVDVQGIKNPTKDTLTGVFVHQDVKRKSSFRSSNEKLDKLFQLGIYASYSNMFYQPTDCPTREKLGWCNDAQASVEQFLTNFETERFWEKWLVDLWDAMKTNGELPAVVPTSGWGYEWGGPVCDGALFEVPYRLYLHTGNKQPLVDSLPYFDRYLAMLKSYEDENKDVTIGLCDWAAANRENPVSATFVNSVYRVKFLRIAALAARLAGKDTAIYENQLKEQIAVHKEKYVNSDGTCKIHKLAAAAMTIYYDLYNNLAPLAAQLIQLVEENDFHHDCGMVGLRHLYIALNKCGLQEYAYKILTATGYPSYFDWMEDGATTLYEHWWERDSSFNHHMYSDFMSWMIKTILGITVTYEKTLVTPYYFKDLSFASGHCEETAVSWKRQDGKIYLDITVQGDRTVMYDSKILVPGTHHFVILDDER